MFHRDKVFIERSEAGSVEMMTEDGLVHALDDVIIPDRGQRHKLVCLFIILKTTTGSRSTRQSALTTGVRKTWCPYTPTYVLLCIHITYVGTLCTPFFN